MKRFLILIVTIVVFTNSIGYTQNTKSKKFFFGEEVQKPRIINMTDLGADPDDKHILNVIDTTRLRVMITTDLPDLALTNGGDPDDIQSMIRFLLFSNEFDIEGLIASAGTHIFTADKNRIFEMLDLYDQVDENLRKHDPKYPTADYLRSITYQGMGNEGPIDIKWHCNNGHWEDIIGEGRNCEASEAIIAAADKDDPRPIYIEFADRADWCLTK